MWLSTQLTDRKKHSTPYRNTRALINTSLQSVPTDKDLQFKWLLAESAHGGFRSVVYLAGRTKLDLSEMMHGIQVHLLDIFFLCSRKGETGEQMPRIYREAQWVKERVASVLKGKESFDILSTQRFESNLGVKYESNRKLVLTNMTPLGTLP